MVDICSLKLHRLLNPNEEFMNDCGGKNLAIEWQGDAESWAIPGGPVASQPA